jgi:CTP synthase (UTP-ammonia lyase)
MGGERQSGGSPAERLRRCLVASRNPYRDDEVAYAAVRHCLRSGTPFLGTCGGFQYACVELARCLVGVSDAAHAETDPNADDLAVVALSCALFGESRLVTPIPMTRVAATCGSEPFEGFHWCGYGLAQDMAKKLAGAGVVISAVADDVGVEAVELVDHPFFVATAFQPQVGSSARRSLHPLISAFISAARLGQPREAA